MLNGKSWGVKKRKLVAGGISGGELLIQKNVENMYHQMRFKNVK